MFQPFLVRHEKLRVNESVTLDVEEKFFPRQYVRQARVNIVWQLLV